MFGLTFDKIFIVGIIAAFLIGPARLPEYSAKLARLVKGVRALASEAQSRLKDEVGEEFDDLDWKKLDPRQYDPRNIIREALREEPATEVTISTPSPKAQESGPESP
jgi:sec-independent protein translocase protein TatB